MKRNIQLLTGILLAALWLSACASQPANPTTPASAQPTQMLAEPTSPASSADKSDPALLQTDVPGTEPSESATLPDCTSPAAPSPAMTEGPYYKAGSPERASLLEEGMPGTRLVLTGYVLDSNCQPVANAWLDFWQADANGAYDNTGYTLRGHQLTDENGRYQLETVVPGLYPGRTEHIHVKVQAPDGPVLTTQLFLPGVASNESDQIFSPELLIKVIKEPGGRMEAEFNFILAAR